jgi:hypothetical protein
VPTGAAAPQGVAARPRAGGVTTLKPREWRASRLAPALLFQKLGERRLL